MSHFNVCVLVKRDESGLEQMAHKASTMLEKFDNGKEMEPYKYYIKKDQIQQMSERYGLDPTNLSALAEKLESWDGDKGGVDEVGLYGISTQNPEGHINYWSVFDEVKLEDRKRLLLGERGQEKIVRAIVTHEGEWIGGPWVYGSPDAEQEKELEVWEKKVLTLLDENTDSVAFLADCHT